MLANLPPWIMGGAEHQTARLVEQWCLMGAHVEVAGFRIPDGVVRLGVAEVRTHRLRSIAGLGRISKGATYLASLLAFARRHRKRFDIAYCRGLADAALSLSLARRLDLWRSPILAVPINARGQGDASFLRSVPFWPQWGALMNRHLAAINLINREIASELDDLGLCLPRRSFIPNGIDVRPPIARTHVGQPRRLMWTGRFEHQKGLDLLVDALRGMNGVEGRCTVDLYGDGPLRQYIADVVASNGLGRVVRFGGVLGTDEVRARLAEADAFVLPSRYEGMSNSALEAMEAGLPVLCTSCGGIDRSVQEGAGWVCAASDPDDLSRALREMLSETGDAWLEKGRQARLLVEQRFRIAEVAARNLELLHDLAKARA
ncbi:glycosyltransferase family 4 protein [Luteimonas sp. M1R5S18]|uniref:Glycosyltransferase family 4 protein n=1 Tax=Luteimonas rhizosphaericola TaxID=3042024 RepID=A0ABT6JKW6_9GAMM|nr:glycosyltransferase family 4 protein [Luteimonas rhizosphaericola]MDH5831324.1 glycosyltransferase family 4 protein [Luteimonas rhizosphaericola]